MRSTRKGFTLIELLVVVAIIGILAAMLLPALASGRMTALKAACASNERQIYLSFAMYANDNKGKVVVTSPGSGAGNWLWDVGNATRNILLKDYGLTRKVCYDPAWPQHDVVDTSGNSLMWNYNNGSYSVWGYFLIIQRVPTGFGNMQKTAENQYVSDLTYDPRNYPYNQKPQAMITDATLSANGNFAFVASSTPGVTHRSPHLSKGNPIGGNVCFTDGHVEWKNFGNKDVMYVRYPSGSSNVPLHWW